MKAFETGVYRNFFAEIGITEEEIDRRLKEIVDTFFYGDDDKRVYYPAEPDMGYLEDTGNHDARTEGMSYGMMMCVQLDMKEEFDRIWRWSKKYMYMDEGEDEGYFAWSCQVTGEKNAMGPAPDGEEYFAMALFFASHRWGDGEGIYNYSQQAREILRAALHKGENGRPGAPMWNRENHLILFVPGAGHTDPSYHLPHFYELFALWAYEEDRGFWKEAAKASREFLSKACHPVTGLNPDSANFDATPMSGIPWWKFTDESFFYSDAYRTAANIGLDYEWFGVEAGHEGVPLRMMRFFKTNLEAARCAYAIDGKPLDMMTVMHPTGVLAATAEGALTVPYKEGDPDWETAARWVKWFWDQPLREGGRRYYDNCLYIFAFLALSGRYRIW